ncbi:MAG: tetratricopeptide repeat protein [Ferruginibacter sp.]
MKHRFIRVYIIITILFICISPFILSAQKAKADSLQALLSLEKTDTGKVKLLWKQADAMTIYNPEKALILSQQALFLATRIKYLEGESRSLGIMANSMVKMGNYPRALDYNIRKLKLEEKRKNPRNMASVLMNIGVVHNLSEAYDKALQYYSASDSVINLYAVEDLRVYSAINLGDVYNRLKNVDSAYAYFNKALQYAIKLENVDLIGTAQTGLAHAFREQGNLAASKLNYAAAIPRLKAENDDEVLCEALLGFAKLYKLYNQSDSLEWYAKQSQQIAKTDGFLNYELDACEFLAEHYKNQKNVDSAFTYMNYVQAINESINNKASIRESQIITSNEQLRQQEIEENKRIMAKERSQQLQLLFIGMFIPGFFLASILLSRINIPIRLIKILGVLSLLFLFEYLTLFLHPYVQEITHHTPVYEILIFVSIATILIPTHHKIEHWFVEKLTSIRQKRTDHILRVKKQKIKLKR